MNAPLTPDMFIALGRDGSLHFTRCTGCGTWQWPPLARCRRCGGTLEWAPVGGGGTVTATCEVHRGVVAPFDRQVPYSLAVVELDEGPELITRADPGLRRGDRTRLSWVESGQQRWPHAMPQSS